LICKLFDINALRTLFAIISIFTRMFIGFCENHGTGGHTRKTPKNYRFSQSKPASKSFFEAEIHSLKQEFAEARKPKPEAQKPKPAPRMLS
jgi:hypothetical protein